MGDKGHGISGLGKIWQEKQIVSCWTWQLIISAGRKLNAHFAEPADLPGAHLPCRTVRSTDFVSLVGETAGVSKMDHPKFRTPVNFLNYLQGTRCAVMKSNHNVL